MTPAQKRKFINELVDNVRKDILLKLPLLPDHWDGHELRRYIADRFEQTAFTLKPGNLEPSFRRRLRAYRNAVIVGDL